MGVLTASSVLTWGYVALGAGWAAPRRKPSTRATGVRSHDDQIVAHYCDYHPAHRRWGSRAPEAKQRSCAMVRL